MSDKKYFVLLNSDGTDSDHVFVSKQPRGCLLYTTPSPRDRTRSRMPSSA